MGMLQCRCFHPGRVWRLLCLWRNRNQGDLRLGLLYPLKKDKDAFNKKKDFSGTEYDVAHVRWGGKFRMANASKCRELWEQCSHEMVTQEGVYGIRFTGDNGGSIFIPAAGFIFGNILYNVGTSGYSWTSSIFSEAPYEGWTLDYCNKMPATGIDNDRCVGHTIRPVIH